MRRSAVLPVLAGLLVVAASAAILPRAFVLIPASGMADRSAQAAADDPFAADDPVRVARVGRVEPAGTFGPVRAVRAAALDPLSADLRAESASHGELADPDAVLADARLGTYIEEVLLASDSLVTRWPVRGAEPVRYWVQPGAALEGWTPTHRRMVRDAFGEWNEAGLPVRFAYEPDSADADVVVLWRDQFDEPISGKTRWTHDRRGWIRTARVTIALRRYTGDPLDAEAVRAITLHEIGHALGLDHTADASNVMAPKVRVRALSAADRATAQLLYRLPAGSLKVR